jgi:adenosylcobyric acid synthase
VAKAIMVQGTGSGVGKSIIVAGLCRIFRDQGINVAPFKAQNMALNSFITAEGGEIGRAQAYQAEAARIPPCVDMNPVLLKATGEACCQVILNGKVHANMQAHEYYGFRKGAWAAATKAYERLSKQYDLIVIEGAGSPAEINLSKDEIVNMSIARFASAPVLLVGDIDKGGVFASLYGTLALLNDDAEFIKAFIINKFRGDLAILQPGLDMIHEKTGRPVLGVIPYLGDLGLHEEDGIPVERLGLLNRGVRSAAKIKIVVVRIRYISNFTDFDPFLYEPDVELVYSLRDTDIEHADLVIIPGSKNTVQDLLFLRESGIEKSLRKAVEKGIPLIGMCGGYQMIGKKIYDPHGVESEHREISGMDFLDIETTLEETKVTSQVEAFIQQEAWSSAHGEQRKDREKLTGYEIHMGRTTGDVGLFRIKRLAGGAESIFDGSARGSVWGTYIHGLFDNDGFRHGLINALRMKRGLPISSDVVIFSEAREHALDAWAGVLQKSIDMNFIEKLFRG